MSRRTILTKLKAAGLVGRQRRPLAEIEADIAAVEARLANLNYERSCLLKSENAKKLHRSNPEFVRKLRAGRAAAHQDPVRRAQWRDRVWETRLANGDILPEMSHDQRLAYNRMRRKGVVRDEALKVALA